MGFLTADLCDAHMDRVADGRVSILAPGVFQSYGRSRQFYGPARTLKVFEDNSLVREALERPGAGGVLVVDGGGSMRRALLGDNIAAAARDNLWVGIIINGCVRDVDEINTVNIGIKALGSHPLKSLKQDQGEKDVQVVMAGSKISPGDWIYADSDGILVSHGEKIHTLEKARA